MDDDMEISLPLRPLLRALTMLCKSTVATKDGIEGRNVHRHGPSQYTIAALLKRQASDDSRVAQLATSLQLTTAMKDGDTGDNHGEEIAFGERMRLWEQHGGNRAGELMDNS